MCDFCSFPFSCLAGNKGTDKQQWDCFLCFPGPGQTRVYPRCHRPFSGRVGIVITVGCLSLSVSFSLQLLSFLEADRWLVLLNATLVLKTVLF